MTRGERWGERADGLIKGFFNGVGLGFGFAALVWWLMPQLEVVCK